MLALPAIQGKTLPVLQETIPNDNWFKVTFTENDSKFLVNSNDVGSAWEAVIAASRLPFVTYRSGNKEEIEAFNEAQLQKPVRDRMAAITAGATEEEQQAAKTHVLQMKQGWAQPVGREEIIAGLAPDAPAPYDAIVLDDGRDPKMCELGDYLRREIKDFFENPEKQRPGQGALSTAAVTRPAPIG